MVATRAPRRGGRATTGPRRLASTSAALLVAIGALQAALGPAPAAAAPPLPGGQDDPTCARVTLLYPDEAVNFLPVLPTASTSPDESSFVTAAAVLGAPTDPVATAAPLSLPVTTDLRHLATPGCNGDCLAGAYLEMDLWVPQLVTKATYISIRNSANKLLLHARVPPEQQTRYRDDVITGAAYDVLANRVKILLSADDTESSYQDLATASKVYLERGGDHALRNTAPDDHDQVYFTMTTLRLRRDCKECGAEPRGQARENMIVPLMAHDAEVAVGDDSTWTPAEGTLRDASPVIDWACMCAMPQHPNDPLAGGEQNLGGVAIYLEEFRRSESVWLNGVSLRAGVASSDAPLVQKSFTKATTDANGNAVALGAWHPMIIQLSGRDNLWPALAGDAGMPPWEAVVAHLRYDHALPAAPTEDQKPKVRGIKIMGSPDPAHTFGTYLSSPSVAVTLTAGHGNATYFVEDGATPAPLPDSPGDGIIHTEADMGAPLLWNDATSNLAAGSWASCVASGDDAATAAAHNCDGLELWFDVRVRPPAAATEEGHIHVAQQLWLIDADGTALVAPIDEDAMDDQRAQAVKAVHKGTGPDSIAYTTVQVPLALWGVATVADTEATDAALPHDGAALEVSPGSPAPMFDPTRLARVTVFRDGADALFEAEMGVPPTEYEVADIAFDVRAIRVGRPVRVGHVSDPADYNVDNMACDPLVGTFDMSNWAPHYPVRYSHCRECCCFFDDPGSGPNYVKHCYEQGDIISEVTPSVHLYPNDQCQVCNRNSDPQNIVPRNTLLAPGAQPPYFTCDDGEACTHTDQCTDLGACVATVYTTCYYSDFWLGDPSRNCEVCDGSGPDSPTKGCTTAPWPSDEEPPRTGGPFFVHNPGTDERSCGCFIDGQVWPHLAINPDFPCQKCDVTWSTTEWTNLPDDVKCDVTQQLDWLNLAAQACTYQHTCLNGICGGRPYTCPPIQSCEAPQDGWPNVCNLEGPLQEVFAGCYRDTRPAGVACGAPALHACEPRQQCTGIVGTCPPQIELPGIIYEDEEKQIDLKLPDGSDADAAIAVVPSLSRVDASYYRYQVQCGHLMLRMAIIPDILPCEVTSVSYDLGKAFGVDTFAGPVRGAHLLREGETALGYIAGSDLLYFNAADPASVTPADAVVPMDPFAGNASAVVDRACDCVPEGAVDMELFRTTWDVLDGVLIDAHGAEVPFTLPPVSSLEAWTRVSADVSADDQVVRDFDWTQVSGMRLRRAGPLTDESIPQGTPVMAVRGLAVRTRRLPQCQRAFVLEGEHSLPAAAPGFTNFELSASDAAAGGDAIVHDVSALWDEVQQRFYVETYLSLMVLSPTGKAPVEVTLYAPDGEGISAPVSRVAASSVQPGDAPATRAGAGFNPADTSAWVRVWARVRPGVITTGFSDLTWRDIWTVGVRFADRASVAFASQLTVRDLYLVTGRGCAPAIDDASNGLLEMFGGTSRRALHLLPNAETKELVDSINMIPDVALFQFDLNLKSAYDSDCQCFPETVMEVDVEVENKWCFLERVEALILDGERGLSVKLPPLPQSAGWQEGDGPMRGVVRVALDSDAATVIGPPTPGLGDWPSVNLMRFERSLAAEVPESILGDITVHSVTVRRVDVPCDNDHALSEDEAGPDNPAMRQLIGGEGVALRRASHDGSVLSVSTDDDPGSIAPGRQLTQQRGFFRDGGAYVAPWLDTPDPQLHDVAVAGLRGEVAVAVGEMVCAAAERSELWPLYASSPLPRPGAELDSFTVAPVRAGVAYARDVASGAGLWSVALFGGAAATEDVSGLVPDVHASLLAAATNGGDGLVLLGGGAYTAGGASVTVDGPAGHDPIALQAPLHWARPGNLDAVLIGMRYDDASPAGVRFVHSYMTDTPSFDEAYTALTTAAGDVFAVATIAGDVATGGLGTQLHIQRLSLAARGPAAARGDRLETAWRVKVGGFGSSFRAAALSAHVDPATGRLYVSGVYTGSNTDNWLACASPDPDNAGTCDVNDGTAHHLPAASEESGFVLGVSLDTGAYEWQATLAGASGAVTLASGGSGMAVAGSVLVVAASLDGADAVTAGGLTGPTGAAGSTSGFVVAFDTDAAAGTALWVRSLTSTGANGQSACTAVVADAGAFAVAASVDAPGSGSQSQHHLTDASGTADGAHARVTGSMRGVGAAVFRVHAADGGGMVVAGTDVEKWEWREAFGSVGASGTVRATHLATAADGALVVAGSLSPGTSVAFGDPIQAKYHPSGASLRALAFRTFGPSSENYLDGDWAASEHFLAVLAPPVPGVEAASTGTHAPDVALRDASPGDVFARGMDVAGGLVVVGGVAVGGGAAYHGVAIPEPSDDASLTDATVGFVAVMDRGGGHPALRVREGAAGPAFYTLGGDQPDPDAPGMSASCAGVAAAFVAADEAGNGLLAGDLFVASVFEVVTDDDKIPIVGEIGDTYTVPYPGTTERWVVGLNGDGTVLWVSTVDGNTGGDDTASAIAASASTTGVVVAVAGSTDGIDDRFYQAPTGTATRLAATFTVHGPGGAATLSGVVGGDNVEATATTVALNGNLIAVGGDWRSLPAADDPGAAPGVDGRLQVPTSIALVNKADGAAAAAAGTDGFGAVHFADVSAAADAGAWHTWVAIYSGDGTLLSVNVGAPTADMSGTAAAHLHAVSFSLGGLLVAGSTTLGTTTAGGDHALCLASSTAAAAAAADDDSGNDAGLCLGNEDGWAGANMGFVASVRPADGSTAWVNGMGAQPPASLGPDGGGAHAAIVSVTSPGGTTVVVAGVAGYAPEASMSFASDGFRDVARTRLTRGDHVNEPSQLVTVVLNAATGAVVDIVAFGAEAVPRPAASAPVQQASAAAEIALGRGPGRDASSPYIAAPYDELLTAGVRVVADRGFAPDVLVAVTQSSSLTAAGAAVATDPRVASRARIGSATESASGLHSGWDPVFYQVTLPVSPVQGGAMATVAGAAMREHSSGVAVTSAGGELTEADFSTNSPDTSAVPRSVSMGVSAGATTTVAPVFFTGGTLDVTLAGGSDVTLTGSAGVLVLDPATGDTLAAHAVTGLGADEGRLVGAAADPIDRGAHYVCGYATVASATDVSLASSPMLPAELPGSGGRDAFLMRISDEDAADALVGLQWIVPAGALESKDDAVHAVAATSAQVVLAGEATGAAAVFPNGAIYSGVAGGKTIATVLAFNAATGAKAWGVAFATQGGGVARALAVAALVDGGGTYTVAVGGAFQSSTPLQLDTAAGSGDPISLSPGQNSGGWIGWVALLVVDGTTALPVWAVVAQTSGRAQYFPDLTPSLALWPHSAVRGVAIGAGTVVAVGDFSASALAFGDGTNIFTELHHEFAPRNAAASGFVAAFKPAKPIVQDQTTWLAVAGRGTGAGEGADSTSMSRATAVSLSADGRAWVAWTAAGDAASVLGGTDPLGMYSHVGAGDPSASGQSRAVLTAYSSDGAVEASQVIGGTSTGATFGHAVDAGTSRVAVAGWRAGDVSFVSDPAGVTTSDPQDVGIGRAMLGFRPFVALLAPGPSNSLTRAASLLARGPALMDIARTQGEMAPDDAEEDGPGFGTSVESVTAAIGQTATFYGVTRPQAHPLSPSSGGDAYPYAHTPATQDAGSRSVVMARDRVSRALLWSRDVALVVNASSTTDEKALESGVYGDQHPVLWPHLRSTLDDMAASSYGGYVCAVGSVRLDTDLDAEVGDLINGHGGAGLGVDETQYAADVLGARVNLTSADLSGTPHQAAYVSCWCDGSDSGYGTGACAARRVDLNGHPLDTFWPSQTAWGTMLSEPGFGTHARAVAVSRSVTWVAGHFTGASLPFARGSFGVYEDSDPPVGPVQRCFVAAFDVDSGRELGAFVFGGVAAGASCTPRSIALVGDGTGTDIVVSGLFNAGTGVADPVLIREDPPALTLTPLKADIDTPFLVRLAASEYGIVSSPSQPVLFPVYASAATSASAAADEELVSGTFAEAPTLHAAGDELYLSGMFSSHDIAWNGVAVTSPAADVAPLAGPTSACYVARLTLTDYTGGVLLMEDDGTVATSWLAALGSDYERNAVRACADAMEVNGGRVLVAVSATESLVGTTTATVGPAERDARVVAPLEGARRQFAAVARLGRGDGRLEPSQSFGWDTPLTPQELLDARDISATAYALAAAPTNNVGSSQVTSEGSALLVGAYHGELACDATGGTLARPLCTRAGASPGGASYTALAHRPFEYSLFSARLEATAFGTAPGAGSSTADAMTTNARLIEDVREYTVQMELWLADLDRPLLRGEWRARSGDGAGLVFDLNEAQQRASGARRWALIEAKARVAPYGHRGAAAKFGTVGGEALLGDLNVLTLRGAAVRGDGGGDEPDVLWRVRNVKLVTSSPDCVPCGQVGVHNAEVTLAATSDPSHDMCELRPPSGVAVPALPTDLSSLIDPGCNCLRGVTVRWQELVADDPDDQVDVARVALLGPGGEAGVSTAAIEYVDAGDEPFVDDQQRAWRTAEAVLRLSDHTAPTSMDWGAVPELRFLTTHADGASCAEAGTATIRSVVVERLCPRSDALLHPRPTSDIEENTEVLLTREGLNMERGSYYRVLSVETNMYGEAGSFPTCSPRFIADDTPPYLGPDVVVIDVLPTEDADFSDDIVLTPFQHFKLGWVRLPEWDDALGLEPAMFFEPDSSPTNLLLFRVEKVTEGAPDGPEVPGMVSEEKNLPIVSNGFVSTLGDMAELQDGVQYFPQLGVCNLGKLCISVPSTGVVVDASPPTPIGGVGDGSDYGSGPHDAATIARTGAPFLRDVLSIDLVTFPADADHSTDPTQLHVMWDGFEDVHTGVASVDIAVGTFGFGANIHFYEAIEEPFGDRNSHTFYPPPGESLFLEGQAYHVIFRVVNLAGAFTDYRTDGLYFDTSIPEVDYALDIMPREIQGVESYYTEHNLLGDIDLHDGTVVRAKFNCYDPESVGVDAELGLRGTMTYRWRVCDTAACGEVYFDWMDVGATQRGTSPGDLPGGATGYVVQFECTNPAGLINYGFSDGVVVDTTPPDTSAAAVEEAFFDAVLQTIVYGADVDYINTPWVAFEWFGFTTTPPHPSIVAYYWKLESEAVDGNGDVIPGSRTEVLPFTATPDLATRAQTDAAVAALQDNTRYVVTVRALTSAGSHADVESDGVKTDFSTPAHTVEIATVALPAGDTDGHCPNLECVLLPDRDDLAYLTRRDLFAFDVLNVVSPESPIAKLQYCISTCASDDDVCNALTITTNPDPNQENFQITGLSMFHAGDYCARVWLTNAAGGSNLATSPAFRVDLTPPVNAFVHEGLSPVVDDDAILVTDSLSVAVGCNDPESGIHHREVRIWHYDEADVRVSALDWFDIGLDTQVTLTSLSLQHAGVYHTSVRCFNNAGVYAEADSDGFVVDMSDPETGGVSILPEGASSGSGAGGEDWFDGTPHDLGVVVTHVPARDGLAASWSGFYDPESSIEYYLWSIADSSGGTTLGLTNVGPEPWAEAVGLGLVDGETYFVTVFAVNHAGRTSSSTSAGITIDATAPNAGSAPSVVTVEPTSPDGAPGYINSATDFGVTWDEVVEPHSAVEYLVAVGTQPYGEQELPWTSAGADTSYQVTGASLTPGVEYYVSMRAVNEAGLEAVSISSKVLCDPLAPRTGKVVDGDSMLTARVAVGEGTLRCAWDGWVDDVSGVASYRVSFGTAAGAADTVPVQVFDADPDGDDPATSPPARSGAVTETDLSLTLGTRYFCTVVAVDRAGNVATVSSPGVVYDTTPPVVGEVNDNAGTVKLRKLPDVDHQVETDRIGVSWSGWSDPQTGITRFSWCAGTTAGECDVVPARYVAAHVASASASGLSLAVGTEVFVTLKAFNVLNMESSASSDGVVVAPSSVSHVVTAMGAAAHVGFLTSISAADHTWCACDDANAAFDAAAGTCVCNPGYVLDASATGDGQPAACVPCGGGNALTGPAGACKWQAGNALELCDASNCATPHQDVSGWVPPDLGNLIACGDAPPTDVIPDAVQAVDDGAGNCVCPPGSKLLRDADTGVGSACVPCSSRAASLLPRGATGLSGVQQLYSTAPGDDTECSACHAAEDPDVVLSVLWHEADFAAINAAKVVVASYEVSIGTTSGATRWPRVVAADPSDGDQVGPPVEYHVQYSSRGDPGFHPPLHEESTLYAFVKARTPEGIVVAEQRVETRVIDFTPPTLVDGAVLDGPVPLTDVEIWDTDDTVAASWGGAFADSISGITLYEVSYGTAPGLDDVYAVTQLAGAVTSHSATLAAPLAQGTPVFATVTAVNDVGAWVQGYSDGAVVQSVVPGGTAVVRGDDGRGPDSTPYPHRHALSQAATTYIEAAWDFADLSGGAVSVLETADGREALSLSFTWRVEDQATGVVVKEPTNVGSATAVRAVYAAIPDANAAPQAPPPADDGSVALSSLSVPLAPGERYVVIVQAANVAGVTATATSLPVLVDGAAPTNGVVSMTAEHAASVAGASGPPDSAFSAVGPQDEIYQTSETTLSLQWSFEDADSTVPDVTVAVGGVAGGISVLLRSGVAYADGAAPSVATFPGLELQHGECYIAQASGTDEAGLQSLYAKGVPTCVDATAPEVLLDVAASASLLVSDAIDDGAGGVVGGVDYVQGAPNAATAELALAPVIATALFDSRHPDARAEPTVYTRPGLTAYGDGIDASDGSDTNPADGRTPGGASLLANVLDAESGISTAEIAWTTTDSFPDVGGTWHPLNALALGAAGQVIVDGGVLVADLLSAHGAGTPLFSHIRVYNGAGVPVHQSSPRAVVLDDTAPAATSLTMARFSRNTASLTAVWAFDEQESTLAGHAVELTEDASGAVVVAPRWVGRDTRVLLDELSLASGVDYRLTVTACNAVGLCASQSAVVTIDTSAPAVGVVHVGAADPALVDSLCDLVTGVCATIAPEHIPAGGPSAEFLSFAGFRDQDSGIAEYLVAVGTAPWGSQLGDPLIIAGDGVDDSGERTVSLATLLPEDLRVLYDSETLFVTVTAANQAGGRASFVAPLWVVDALAPPVGIVTFGGAATEAATVLEPGDHDVAFELGDASARRRVAQLDQPDGSDEVVVTWTSFEDAAEEPVASHEVTLSRVSDGAVVGGPLVVSGSAVSATLSSLSLALGDEFIATVTAADAAGNLATVRTTAALVMEGSAPVATCEILDGVDGTDIDCVPRGGLEALVDPRADTTFLSEQELAVRDSLAAKWHIIDARPEISGIQPVVVAVPNELVSDEQQQLEVPDEVDSIVSARWCPFADDESGVATTLVGLGTAAGADDVVPFQTVPGRRNAVQYLLPLQDEGTTLFVTVVAQNAVGLSTAVSSDGMRVLCTPGTTFCDWDGTFLCMSAVPV